MPDEPNQENDPMEEELTLSQIEAEFKIKHSTLGVWVWSGKLPARIEFSELGQKYYMVKRGEVVKFLAKRTNDGRHLKPPKTPS